ncbi:fructose-2,6-bisphosphatase-like protein [Kalaharituber pfeilii]|nr:fructose-2,6-bisphosphatase-like protein [Kalaharituber pfeilii]
MSNNKQTLLILTALRTWISHLIFFDPKNAPAKQLREKVAMETLDELLNYILYENGSVGILDATNSTRERRTAIVKRIRERAGNELGIVFLESECRDEKLLEANMRLKLSGPDYKGMDPTLALEDFKRRVKIYEDNYEPVGDYEEQMNWQYIKMVDVGRKVVAHQIRGFLAGQTVYYLLNFNLAPRQIWITRHGESMDNINGRIGGDAKLSPDGDKYARALAKFIDQQRHAFNIKMQEKHASSLLPPRPGDITPPNPEYTIPGNDPNSAPAPKNFCVWTSMLQRSIDTAKYFDEEEYDIKEMRMLNELNAGVAEGMTYEEIRTKFPEEYNARRLDKLHYRYPGAGGESYLDVINRLRAVIVEAERMTDHVLLIGHRVVARVLLAYFLGLDRDDVACLDVPLGMLYVLEPKPYGVGFQAYQYNPETQWFDHIPDYKVKTEKQLQ